MHANVLLLGLDEQVAAELAQALQNDGHNVSTVSFENPDASARRVAESMIDVVFCGDAPSRLIPLLAALRQRHCPIPVVVASRVPDTSRWLDAIEAGAWDYCGAPFEPRLVRHILDNALTYPRVLALAG